MKRVEKEVNPRFESFLFDWDYKTYLLFGGYGSSKSYHIALKIVLKLLEEKRKVLVVREVYETMRESCYDLIEEIIESMGLLEEDSRKRKSRKIVGKTSPLSFVFPNGSKIIFKGMDNPAKLKSINDVSIIWCEEASELKYAGYKELLGRLRHVSASLHIFLSWNPVDEQNWTYKHFFIDTEADKTYMNPEKVYAKRTVVKKRTYYHHSVPDDNLFLPKSYINQLDELKEYDLDLYRVARQGRYGANGRRVIPQLLRLSAADVMSRVSRIPDSLKFNGLDWGFETSYNALIRVAVDDETKTLLIYNEYYHNHQTDSELAVEIEYMRNELITADNEDPKAIKYFNLNGFRMRGCKKWQGSRLSNIKKVKRFRQVIISSDCPNCWRELKTLTYKKQPNGELIYDQFNIDPHTFSAIWYALDLYNMPDIKRRQRNSKKGAA